MKFLESDHTDILSAATQLQFQKLVVELLEQMPPSERTWVICLDALDECGKDRGQVFLKWLSNLITRIPTNIRFFLTGRPDVPSYLKFDDLKGLMYEIVLDDIDSNADIKLYIKTSLDGSTWTPRDAWRIESSDINKIANLAKGVFVFAATAVRYVQPEFGKPLPQTSMSYLLKDAASLNDLDDLYKVIVNEAIRPVKQNDLRSEDAHQHSMQVLSTILGLFEPLTAQSLATVLQMDVDTLFQILVPLSAVICVPKTSGETIKIIHLSFREFMTSRVKRDRPDLLCGTEDHQATLAHNLLQVMHNGLKFNICDLPTSYLRNIEMPNRDQCLKEHIGEHLRYACRFWVDHLEKTAYNLRNAKAAKDLLLKKFLFWLEVLSLLQMVGNAQHALSKLAVWIQEV